MSRRPTSLDPTAAHSLAVRDLTVSYHRVPALHHIAFEVRCGESVALLGPNGAGTVSYTHLTLPTIYSV